METVFRSSDVPAAERFGRWHDLGRQLLVPTEVSTEHRADFHATLRVQDLGAVQVSAITCPPLRTRRTCRLIHRSDPEVYQLALTARGCLNVTQYDREATVGTRNLVLYNMSRPFDGRVVATGAMSAAFFVAQFPRAMLPLPTDKVDRLAAAPLPAYEGVGALVSAFLTRLVRRGELPRPADVIRMGTVLLDLLSALLAHHLDLDAGLAVEVRHRALVMRIHAFIEQHLPSQQLTPTSVAAAHHISLRTLHYLFREYGMPVAEWIRHRRPERCRRDLADPGLWSTPVHEIGQRWGFADGAHFSRAFKAAYGMPPGTYRQQALVGGAGESGRA